MARLTWSGATYIQKSATSDVFAVNPQIKLYLVKDGAVSWYRFPQLLFLSKQHGVIMVRVLERGTPFVQE